MIDLNRRPDLFRGIYKGLKVSKLVVDKFSKMN